MDCALSLSLSQNRFLSHQVTSHHISSYNITFTLHLIYTIIFRLGRNEKTKVIAKMQMPGSGAPCREPGVSEAEKSAMMAFYFKKQEVCLVQFLK